MAERVRRLHPAHWSGVAWAVVSIFAFYALGNNLLAKSAVKAGVKDYQASVTDARTLNANQTMASLKFAAGFPLLCVEAEISRSGVPSDPVYQGFKLLGNVVLCSLGVAAAPLACKSRKTSIRQLMGVVALCGIALTLVRAFPIAGSQLLAVLFFAPLAWAICDLLWCLIKRSRNRLPDTGGAGP